MHSNVELLYLLLFFAVGVGVPVLTAKGPYCMSDGTTWVFNSYADDTQLNLSFSSLNGDNQASSVAQIESYARNIDRWMVRNKLKLKRLSCLLLTLGTSRAHHWKASYLEIVVSIRLILSGNRSSF